MTKAKVNERGGINQVITVKTVDLNRDGQPEFIVDCSCEVMSSVYVFRKTASGVEIIYWGTQREIIIPLNTYTKGWRNLRSTVYRSVDGATSSETLRWNGSEYK